MPVPSGLQLNAPELHSAYLPETGRSQNCAEQSASAAGVTLLYATMSRLRGFEGEERVVVRAVLQALLERQLVDGVVVEHEVLDAPSRVGARGGVGNHRHHSVLLGALRLQAEAVAGHGACDVGVHDGDAVRLAVCGGEHLPHDGHGAHGKHGGLGVLAVHLGDEAAAGVDVIFCGTHGLFLLCVLVGSRRLLLSSCGEGEARKAGGGRCRPGGLCEHVVEAQAVACDSGQLGAPKACTHRRGLYKRSQVQGFTFYTPVPHI